MHQVGDKKLYYDAARSTNHQDYLHRLHAVESPLLRAIFYNVFVIK